MIDLAKKRLGDRALIRLANLEEPLDFVSDKSVDVILSSLVLDYVKHWDSLFLEFSRVLRDEGYLIFSIEHPAAKWSNPDHPRRTIKPKNYFDFELVELVWTGFGKHVPVRSYRRPLGTLFECLGNARFYVERFLETQPTEEFKRVNPEDWDKVRRNPTFLCILARKHL
jgi:SAM-dependent methyltransferase